MGKVRRGKNNNGESGWCRDNKGDERKEKASNEKEKRKSRMIGK